MGHGMARMQLLINGKQHTVEAEPQASLLAVLRDQLDLTGSKYGCGEGQCGACTVLVAGQPRRSCITPVGEVAGKAVTTIEGIEQDGQLHPLQEAFLEKEALQCGYCTSGMIMSGVALLRSNPDPTEHQVREFMQGNICRCGTYPRIVEAVRLAARAGKGAAR